MRGWGPRGLTHDPQRVRLKPSSRDTKAKPLGPSPWSFPSGPRDPRLWQRRCTERAGDCAKGKKLLKPRSKLREATRKRRKRRGRRKEEALPAGAAGPTQREGQLELGKRQKHSELPPCPPPSTPTPTSVARRYKKKLGVRAGRTQMSGGRR